MNAGHSRTNNEINAAIQEELNFGQASSACKIKVGMKKEVSWRQAPINRPLFAAPTPKDAPRKHDMLLDLSDFPAASFM